jgi:IS605 OrfB family transposase
MITIKLPITLNEEDSALLTKLRQQQSTVVRASSKMFDSGFTQKEIRLKLKEYNLPDIDSWIIQSGISSGNAVHTKNKGEKFISGGKYSYKQYLYGNITKAELKQKRLSPYSVIGESPNKGNRKFDLDVKNNNIIFKPFKGKKIELKLPKLKKNIKRKLMAVDELSNDKQMPFTVELFHDNILISFELNEVKRLQSIIKRPLTNNVTRDKAKNKLATMLNPRNSKRVLGIDQNPNYIGLSVIEFDDNDQFKIIHKEVVEFNHLNRRSNKSSKHKLSKYIKNKKKHELIEICKYIANLTNHYDCCKLVLEELNFKDSNNKGKEFNRLCKNNWHRELLTNNLTKRCEELNIEVVNINPAHTSLIGNIIHGNDSCPDMVAASIEIARRGYNKFKKGWFYPKLETRHINNRWKEEVCVDDVDSWKELSSKIKNSKVKYRVSLDETKEFYRFSYSKRKLNRLIFV